MKSNIIMFMVSLVSNFLSDSYISDLNLCSYADWIWRYADREWVLNNFISLKKLLTKDLTTIVLDGWNMMIGT